MKRENFRSRLGFLLVSAGCAIGIGNVCEAAAYCCAGERGGRLALRKTKFEKVTVALLWEK